MSRQYKVILRGEKAREKLLAGIDQVVDTINITLGPFGRNVIMARPYRVPRITNDGWNIAKNILPLKDEFQNLGAESIVDSATKTNEMVGDGTTGTMVLAQAIIKKVFETMKVDKNIVTLGDSSSTNVMDIRRQIRETAEVVVQRLKDTANEIKNHEELEMVATISVEDNYWGKIIADMIKKVGVDGFISVEESMGYEHEYELVDGMNFSGKYSAPFLISEKSTKKCIVNEALLVITNYEFRNFQQMVPLMVECLKNKEIDPSGKPVYKPIRQIVIIAYKYSKEFLYGVHSNMVTDKVRAADNSYGNFNIIALKAPSLTENELEDVAIYSGSKFFDSTKGMKVENIKLEDFGNADRVTATRDNIVIFKGSGSKEKVKERIKEIQEQIKMTKDQMFRMKKERRVAALSGGVGKIGVGAKSDQDRVYLKLKIEDAVNATRAALQEGIVKGGGLALKEIADSLPEDNILKEPLQSPYNQIQENAGGKLEIKDDIFDPVKVVKAIVDNACAFAGTFITAGAAIIERELNLSEIKKFFESKPLPRVEDDNEYDEKTKEAMEEMGEY